MMMTLTITMMITVMMIMTMPMKMGMVMMMTLVMTMAPSSSIYKLNFPGNLCRAAFAILALFSCYIVSCQADFKFVATSCRVNFFPYV